MLKFKNGVIKLSKAEKDEIILLKELHKAGAVKLKFFAAANVFVAHKTNSDDFLTDVVGLVSGLTAKILCDIYVDEIQQGQIKFDLTRIILDFSKGEYDKRIQKSARQIIDELKELGGVELKICDKPVLYAKVRFVSGSYYILPYDECKALYEVLKPNIYNEVYSVSIHSL